MMPPSALTLLQRHVSAVNWQEGDCFPDCQVADAFAWVDHAAGDHYAGPDGYHAYLRHWRVALPNLWFEVQQYGGSDVLAVCQFWLRGTHTGPLVTAAGIIQPTGRDLALAVCDAYRAEDGRLTRIDTFYDRLSLLQQLQQAPTCRQQPFSRFLAN